MSRDLFDTRRHPLVWGTPLLAMVVWHVIDTMLTLGPQYLFFVCYAANALLCFGVFRRSALLVGVGFGWLAIAFPLWLYDAILTANRSLSCALFHIVGLVVGAAAFRNYRLPRHTWLAAVSLAVVLHLLARLSTNEALNINSAFRIYKGWEGMYPSYAAFYLVSLAGFSAVFMALTWLNNRYFCKDEG